MTVNNFHLYLACKWNFPKSQLIRNTKRDYAIFQADLSIRFSAHKYGRYALTPSLKVFIDGRADMYGEQILSNYS